LKPICPYFTPLLGALQLPFAFAARAGRLSARFGGEKGFLAEKTNNCRFRPRLFFCKMPNMPQRYAYTEVDV